jgi:predicted PurR-regulated permease PerM
MKAASDILNTFLLSTLLALAILPVPKWMMRRGLSRGLSIAFTLLIVIIGGLAVLSLLGGSIAGLINALPTYELRLTVMKADVENFLSARGIDVARLIPQDLLSPAYLLNVAATFLSGVAGGLSSALILMVLTMLILAELARSQESHSSTKGTQQRVLDTFNEHMIEVRKYISITGWTGLITAGADYILLLIVGVDFAVTWAVLAFFLSFIPNIGVFLALIPPALLALIASGWLSSVFVIGGFLVISFVVGSLLTPQLMAKGLELSLLLVIGGLVFWTWVLGAPGAIVSVPLTVVVKKLVVEWSSRSNEED